MGGGGDYLVRDARTEDLAAIVGLYADDELGATRERSRDPLDPRYRAAFDRIQTSPDHRLVVLENAGTVIGTLQLSFLPHVVLLGGERAQIEAVRVASGRRGSGDGQYLLRWAIDEARARGCALVQLTTNRSRGNAHRFYEALGFTATHVGMKLDLRQEEG